MQHRISYFAITLACFGALIGLVALSSTMNAGRGKGYNNNGSYIGYVCKDATSVGPFSLSGDLTATYSFIGWGFKPESQTRSATPFTQELAVSSAVRPIPFNPDEDRQGFPAVDKAINGFIPISNYGIDLLPWNETVLRNELVVIEIPGVRTVGSNPDGSEIFASDYFTTVVRDCLLNTIEVALTVSSTPGQCGDRATLSAITGEDAYFCVNLWNASNLVTQDRHRIQIPQLGIDVGVEEALGPGESLQLTSRDLEQLGPVTVDESLENVALTATSSNRGLYFGFPVADEEDAFTTFPATATVSVTNLPPVGALRFDQPNLVVTEASGSTSVIVTRTDGSAGPVSIDYAVAGGTATDGVDFTGGSGTLNFADGATTASFEIGVRDDDEVETDESLILTLNNPTGGAALAVAPFMTLVIADNDQTSCANTSFLPIIGNQGYSSDDTCEPGGDANDFGAAVPLVAGQPVFDSVSQASVLDIYRIDLQAGSTIAITLDGSGGDADLHLFPPGSTSFYGDTPVSSSTSLESYETIDYVVSQSGEWYIIVNSFSGSTEYMLLAEVSSAAASSHPLDTEPPLPLLGEIKK